jgi:hypothetical protein
MTTLRASWASAPLREPLSATEMEVDSLNNTNMWVWKQDISSRRTDLVPLTPVLKSFKRHLPLLPGHATLSRPCA